MDQEPKTDVFRHFETLALGYFFRFNLVVFVNRFVYFVVKRAASTNDQ